MDLLEGSQDSSRSAFRLHALCLLRTGLHVDHISRPYIHQDWDCHYTSSRLSHISQESSSLISSPALLKYADEPVKKRLQQGWLYYHRGHEQRFAHDITHREAQPDNHGIQTRLSDPENGAFTRLWKPNSKGIRSNHKGPVMTP
jgi:hypothetical protein